LDVCFIFLGIGDIDSADPVTPGHFDLLSMAKWQPGIVTQLDRRTIGCPPSLVTYPLLVS
jgi:hypothetical protein